MALNKQDQPVYEFGSFRLVPAERILLRDGKPIQLAPKVFDTLLLLVENGGRLADKSELMSQLWPDAFVEEATLARHISDLRRALGEASSGQKYIETVPKHGYRFVASVNRLDEGHALVVERYTRSRVITEEAIRTTPETSMGEALTTSSGKDKPPAQLVKPALSVVLVSLAGVLLLALILALAYSWTSRKPSGPPTVLQVKSLAVLPFRTLGDDSGDLYLGVGLSDALITRLSNIRRINIRPTSAVLKYATGQDPAAAGRELSVDAVLSGSIQRSEERIRVTVQLVRVSDGAPIWAEKFDEKFTDIFGVQDSISERLVRSLELNLSDEEKQRLAKRNTENTEAYQFYLKGRYFWNKRTEESLNKAIEQFEQAIRLDPNYAMAYAGLADCYNVLISLSLIPSQDVSVKVEAAARRALEIDSALGEAHASLGWARFEQWDWSGAEREFKRAIELNSNYATAHQWYAEYLTAMGRFDEALEEVRRAQQIDPLSLVINMIVGQTYYYGRRYDEAIEQCRKALELDPNFDLAYDRLGMAYLQKGMYQEALVEYKKAKRFDGSPRMLEFMGSAYALSGNLKQARKALQNLMAARQRKYVSPVFIARLYTNLEKPDDAFEWLEEAVRERSTRLVWLKVDPVFDRLRSDPRFAVLQRRVGLDD